MPLGFGFQLGHGQATSSAAINIYKDSDIVRTFSEAVQPATVTNVGDGSGSFELYSETDTAWVAGVLSTSDNIQWTFNPTADFDIGDKLTLHLKDTILTVPNQVTHGGNDYTCILDNIAVEPGVTAGWATYWQDDGAGSSHSAWSNSVNYTSEASYEGPYEVKYNVINRLPVMATFTLPTPSPDPNVTGDIDISTVVMTGTDADGHTVTFGLSETDNSSTVTEYKSQADHRADGTWPSSAVEGVPITVTLYCFPYDGFGVGTSLNDSVDVDIPDTTAPTAISFSCEATSVTNNITILTLDASDNITTKANLLCQINETDTFTTGVGTWESIAWWLANGYTASVAEGSPETVDLYTAFEDEANNISTSLTDSCDVTIPHAPTFSVQPTLASGGALYDGGLFDMTIADVNGAHLVDVDGWDGVSWTRKLTGVAVGAKTDIEVSGIGPGAITNTIKFRVADTGETDFTESNTVDVTTAKPTQSVAGGNDQITVTLTDATGETADSFTIRYGPAANHTQYSVSGSVGANVISANIDNDTEYFVTTVAIEGAITSTPSTEENVTPEAAPFSPADLWLASEEGDYWENDPTTMKQVWDGTLSVINNLDKVGYWLGQKNSIVLSQNFNSADSNRPLYKTADGGSVYFDGTASPSISESPCLGSDQLFTDDNWTVLIAVKTPSQPVPANTHAIFGQSDGGSGRAFYAIEASGALKPYTFVNDGTDSHVSNSAVTTFGSGNYHTLISEQVSATSLSIRVDSGSQEDILTPAAFTPAITVTCLGAIGASTTVKGTPGGGQTEMDVKGIIAIGRALSSQELADSIAWLEAL